MTRVIPLAQARRIALAAQGFRDPRPAGTATMRHLQRVIDRVGVIQIDSVNVLTRSQYLPPFSRLGPYATELLDRARDGAGPRSTAPRRLVEYWAHEASLIPPSTWPLLGFRMRRAHAEAWGGMRKVAREHGDIVTAVQEQIRSRGPLTARQVEAALEHEAPRTKQGWGWNWSLVKNACEHLFWAGQITSAGRTAQFERRYAPLEKVLPPQVVQASPSGSSPLGEEESVTELMRIAARAHGIGTERCLRDYFRLRPEQARPGLAALLHSGELEAVEVSGWRRTAYLHREASIPRRVHAEALLSPFDSLVWQRERTRALFGFDYRLEIYVPAPQRVHGYYVLPFLYGDTLAARADLKADRANRRLLVQSVHWQPDAPADAVPALQRQLMTMAEWLGLGEVHHAGSP